MKVAVTGASGLIGSALVAGLRADGHEVVRLVRRAPQAPDEAGWDPGRHRLDPSALAGAEAVVHLAGAGIGDHRWSGEYKQKVLDSRVDGTTTVSEAIAEMAEPPRVLVSMSAIGYYGDTGEAEVDEGQPRGQGFLADVCAEWEAATGAAEAAGVRVVHPRAGIVLSPAGGALGRMVTLFRIGGGASLGSGRQWWSWISLDDTVAALRFLLDEPSIAGPVNLTAPNPVRNVELTKALARLLHRPAFVKVPAFALRVALGEFADAGLLWSNKVRPRRLTEAGFRFADPDLEPTLRRLLGRG